MLIFGLFVGPVAYSVLQPKTDAKVTEAISSNKDPSTSGQTRANIKTACPVCISRDDRLRRDNSLFIRCHKRMMCLSLPGQSYQRGSVSWCAFILSTLIAGLTVEYISKKQVTLLSRSGARSTCLYGCCANARSTKMGHIDLCMTRWFMSLDIDYVVVLPR